MSFTASLEDLVTENRNGLLGARANWPRRKLREVANILNGFPFESARFISGSSADSDAIPVIRIRDIMRGHTETYYSGTVDPAFLVSYGDLLVGMDGDFNSSLWSGKPAALNQRVCKLSTEESILRKKFLSYILPGYLSAINDVTPSVTVKHLSSRTIGDIPLPIPPLSEQDEIVEEIDTQLSRLEAGVSALKRAQANLKRYRAAVLKAACEGRLVLTEAELARTNNRTYETGEQLLRRILHERQKTWVGRGKYKEPAKPVAENISSLPEGWIWASPGELSSGTSHSLAIGPFGSNLKVSDYQSSGVPLVFVRNIRSGQFTGERTVYVSSKKASELLAHQTSPGDILITKMGDPPGDACLYPAGLPTAVITADCIKWQLSQLLLDRAFFVFAINSNVVKPQILNVTKGVAQLKISLGRFENIAIPLPPLAEQHRIVAEVERRHSVADQLEATIDANLKRATRLRQSILSAAFRGPA